MKKFDLYWEALKIGTVTETNWDMRSSGNIVYTFDYLAEASENPRISEFIKSSITASNYLDEGDEENYQKISLEEEKLYMDLITDTNWYLINAKEETIKILCPIFHDNNEITWQEE